MRMVCGCGDMGQLIPTTNAKTKPRIRNVLRRDPSRMGAIRRKFLAEVNRRFKKLARDIKQLVVTEDAFGLDRSSTLLKLNAASRRWAFQTDANKLESFKAWLKEQIDAGILNESAWSDKYIESAYKKGLVRVYLDSHPELAQQQSVLPGLSESQFLRQSFGAPESVSKLKLLSTRAFEQLKDVTSSMASKMTRSLADDLANGKGALEIGKNLADAAALPIARARTIARTEIMHAHAEGQLDALEKLGLAEVEILVEWSTAGDDRVCPICQPLEGVILTIEEARGLLPRHPSCRCVFIPANVTEGEESQLRAKGRIAQAVSRSIKAETGKKTKKAAEKESTWVGADKTFSGKASQNP